MDDTDEMDFKIRGGNSRLANALARKIGAENIRTEHVVVAIHQIGKRVDVYVQGSSCPIAADYCICAIPAHCMIDIDWGKEPPKETSGSRGAIAVRPHHEDSCAMLTPILAGAAEGGYSVCTNLASDFASTAPLARRVQKAFFAAMPWATRR